MKCPGCFQVEMTMTRDEHIESSHYRDFKCDLCGCEVQAVLPQEEADCEPCKQKTRRPK